jgi:hypothetical protein
MDVTRGRIRSNCSLGRMSETDGEADLSVAIGRDVKR